MKEDASSYRGTPAGGPRVRTDIVDVYVFRGGGSLRVGGPDQAGHAMGGIEFLQVYRASDPLSGTWQPVMGHIEVGETAVQAAAREAAEELGLHGESGAVLGVWALEQVHPYYIAAIDSIVMSPRFAVEVAPTWEPTLNEEHSARRWVPWAELWRSFMWPGQVAACREIAEHLLRPGALASDGLRLTSEDFRALPAAPIERGASGAAKLV